ncbi:uncharacterized protein LOC115910601 [Camarhynchus parvulus]|uniref:uncharacterized protein LOC115910601 n=1 Tax=Geospiza parvula TaxID=87175 RepID=UPI001237C243|nr:uncharacterized protein LOC115910601 [Camarhynchus parvulus]
MGERRRGESSEPGTGFPQEQGCSLLQRAVAVLRRSSLHSGSQQGFQYSRAILVENELFLSELRAFARAKAAAGYSQEELQETFAFLLFDEEEEVTCPRSRGISREIRDHIPAFHLLGQFPREFLLGKALGAAPGGVLGWLWWEKKGISLGASGYYVYEYYMYEYYVYRVLRVRDERGEFPVPHGLSPVSHGCFPVSPQYYVYEYYVYGMSGVNSPFPMDYPRYPMAVSLSPQYYVYDR